MARILDTIRNAVRAFIDDIVSIAAQEGDR